MRLSELTGKEVINIGDGARLGIIEECELTIDVQTGRIHALIVPSRHGFFHIFGDNRGSTIPWRSIKRIGDDVIIVDLSNAYERLYNISGERKRAEDTYKDKF
jgi:YlmC/YmxH family sporulation protein